MLVILVSKLRQKLMLFLRLLLFVSILIIMAGQLWGIFQSSKIYSNWFHDIHPNGNPMRVEQTGQQQEFDIIESIVQVFKNYCQDTCK